MLRLLATGRSNPEIARELTLSTSTVDRHGANIYAKTGTRNRTEAAMWAVTNHLIAP